MAACVARDTTFDALRLDAAVVEDEVDDLWSTTSLRTYLWAMSQQATCITHTRDEPDIATYDDLSREKHITSLSLPFDAMAKPYGPDVSLGVSYPRARAHQSKILTD